MTQIGFACPICDGCFSEQLDYVPDGAVICTSCPHCMYEIRLFIDDATAQIIDLEQVRRLWK